MSLYVFKSKKWKKIYILYIKIFKKEKLIAIRTRILLTYYINKEEVIYYFAYNNKYNI
jgi:hypothetical protein